MGLPDPPESRLPPPDIRDQLQATLGGRYSVEREIGAGGMATVYLARDLKHDRRVALKVLRPELGAVLGVERFLAEIKVTANLQHPNLLPLFDSGEAAGLLFYVMPFVEGESLRARLERDKQLPIDEAVRIATAIAGALDYAHRHGVIHRDLKPENILLHDGQPLIADFGIALAVSNAGGQRITQTGLSLGTPQYMSPEQATGDRAVDGRTDIYSLGALTYEMLTGEAPHVGATAQAIIAKLMTEEVRPLTVLRRTVPPAVDNAVRHALEKLPADRFATANDFAVALRATGDAAPPIVHLQSGPRDGPAAPVNRRREMAAWIVAAVAIAAFAWTFRSLRGAPEAPVIRTSLDLPSGEHPTDPGIGTGLVCSWVALSPQGDRLAYAAAGATGTHTVVRRISELNSHEIVNKGVGSLAFSPDGKWVAYSSGTEIRKVPADGGLTVVLGSASSQPMSPERLPAACAGAGGGADVAVRRRGAGRAQPDLALLAGGQLVAVRIADHDGARCRAAHRTTVREPLRSGDDGGDLRLGAAVQLEDPVGPQPVDPHLLEPLRAGLGQVPDGPQRGQIVGISQLRRKPPDPFHHRGDEVDSVRAVGSRWPRAWPARRSAGGPRRACRTARRSMTTRPGRCGTAARHHQAAVGRAESPRHVRVEGCRIAGHDQLRQAGGSPRRGCLPGRRRDVRKRVAGQAGVGLVARRRRTQAGGQQAGIPITAAGSASSMMALSSRSGSRAETGWGIAPVFQQAATATYQSVEFGSAIVTMSPSPTPPSARSRARRVPPTRARPK